MPVSESPRSLEHAANIVSSFVANNSVRASDLAGLIESVHAALEKLSAAPAEPVPEPVQVPAVSVRKSLAHDYLICLEDGKKFKSMKRHLSKLGMTPEQYRAKWGLASDYPMVAPAYAAQRSEMAKRIGLGRKVEGDPKAGSSKKTRVAKAG